MKRGKNNKARLGANLLRKVKNAEAVIVASIPKPFRASGKSMPQVRHLVMLNNMRCYVLKTKVKNLDPKVIKGFSNIIKLIMTNYSYGENVYHEEPTIENALIPEEHKEKLNDQTNSTENA
jgi:hypothetical protein